MIENPLISILTPLYQSEKFMVQTIESLVNQTYTNLEIILINDGSPDSSGVIADSYALKDARVKVIHQENQGAAAALNNGLRVANGAYIMFLDGDDWLEPKTCEEAIRIAQSENVDLVFWPFIKEFESYSEKEQSTFEKSQKFVNNDVAFLKRRMIGLVDDELRSPTRTDAFNSVWGKLYKVHLLKDINWVDTNLIGSSDVLYNVQMSLKLRSAYYLHEFNTHYRKFNPHSLTRNYNFTLLSKYLSLFKSLEEVVGSNYDNPIYMEALQNRIALSTINIVLSVTAPNVNAPKRAIVRFIKSTIMDERFLKAYKGLNIRVMPIHWKVFFLNCKGGNAVVVYLIALVMRKLR
jgi:glycosyltransferase involved in cell wall biosynthesis